jgi:nitronate monooxygenase
MVRWLLVLFGAIANGRSTGAKKAWRDIWAAGQDIGAVKDILSVADFVDRIDTEYRAAKALLAV